jgi:hypothetical protein
MGNRMMRLVLFPLATVFEQSAPNSHNALAKSQARMTFHFTVKRWHTSGIAPNCASTSPSHSACRCSPAACVDVGKKKD